MATGEEGNGRTGTQLRASASSPDDKTRMLLDKMVERKVADNQLAAMADIMGGIMPTRTKNEQKLTFIDEADGAQSAEMLDERPVIAEREEAKSVNLGKMFKSIAKLYKEMDKPIGALLDEAISIFKEAAGVSDDSVFMVYLRESSIGEQASKPGGEGFSVISLKSGDESLAGIAPDLMKELRIEDAAGAGQIAQFTMSTDQAGGMMLTAAIDGSPTELLTRLLNSKIAEREPSLGGLKLAESFHIANGRSHGGLIVLTRNGSKLTAEQTQILEGLSDVVGELIGLKNERSDMETRLGEQKKVIDDVGRIIASKQDIAREVVEKMDGNMSAASIYRLLQSAGQIMGGELGAVSTFSTVQGKGDVMLAPDMVVRKDGEIADGIKAMSIYSRGVLPTLARVAMQEKEAICVSSGKSSVVFTVNGATGEFARFGAVEGGNPWKSGNGSEETARGETAAVSYAVKGKDGEVRVFSFPIFKEVRVSEKTAVREIGKTKMEFLEAMQIMVNGKNEFGLNDLRRIRLACAQMAGEITLEMQAGKAFKDGLTDLYNRTYFKEEMLREVRKARRSDGEYKFGMLFFDLDNFKKINDTFGHEMGDIVLKTVADAVKQRTRNTDVDCRWGGEEITVLLEGNGAKGVDPEIVKSIAEELRRAVEAIVFKAKDGTKFSVTMSIGATVTSVERNDARGSDEEILNGVIEIADHAMYIAKGKPDFAKQYNAIGFEDGELKNRTFFCDCETGKMEKVGLTRVRKQSQEKNQKASHGGKKASADSGKVAAVSA